MQVKITLKSGATVYADIGDFTTSRSPLDNHLVKINWTTPDDWKDKLVTVNFDEIAAIVLSREVTDDNS